MDCYRNMQDVKRTFLDFMDRVPFYGMIVACNDDPILRRLMPKIRRRMLSYGTREGSDFQISLNLPDRRKDRAAGISISDSRTGGPPNAAISDSCSGGPSGPPTTAGSRDARPLNLFAVKFRDKDLGQFQLHVPGVHNVLNATAAIAVGIGLDISIEKIREALESFHGVDRRFQLRGKAAGVSVIDDYGHHPTEIRATLAAARQCGYRKIHVIFQPHRYTRTRDLMDEFTTAFSDADSLCVLDIYPASEQPIEGITGEALARRISEKGSPTASYVDSFEEAAVLVSASAQPGDMILTLGAGSVSQLAPMLLEKLRCIPIGATAQ
jgi:UDP-N-acetylmuramate--alanine ligase